METPQDAFRNPYSLHYEMLRRQVLDAATVDRESLEDAGVELEGWLLDAFEVPSDCCSYITSFDALKRLHMFDKLAVPDIDGVVTKMQRCDVFFALALAENDAAYSSFSSQAVAAGWDPTSAVQYGLDAAVSAANSYMYGLFLKAQSLSASH
jgi:hypothetical protein